MLLKRRRWHSLLTTKSWKYIFRVEILLPLVHLSLLMMFWVFNHIFPRIKWLILIISSLSFTCSCILNFPQHKIKITIISWLTMFPEDFIVARIKAFIVKIMCVFNINMSIFKCQEQTWISCLNQGL